LPTHNLEVFKSNLDLEPSLDWEGVLDKVYVTHHVYLMCISVVSWVRLISLEIDLSLYLEIKLTNNHIL
jgi:hypothetical protein